MPVLHRIPGALLEGASSAATTSSKMNVSNETI